MKKPCSTSCYKIFRYFSTFNHHVGNAQSHFYVLYIKTVLVNKLGLTTQISELKKQHLILRSHELKTEIWFKIKFEAKKQNKIMILAVLEMYFKYFSINLWVL